MWFHDLSRWDTAVFQQARWLWPDDVLRPLGQVVRRVADEVEADIPKAELPIIGKISFGGDLFLSDEAERAGYKGRLFWARAQQLVYSKIRVKQGSFCVVPAELPAVAVSAEYPVYEIDAQRISPIFLSLLLRSDYMKNVLDGLAHGGGTKTRIHPEQFEALQIPVPSLDVQQAIVNQWKRAQTEVRQAEEQATQREAEAQADFLAALGLTISAQPQSRRRAVAMSWSAMERWGVESNRLARAGGSVAQVRFPIVEGSDCIASVSHGCSASPSAQPTALEVLKISAVTKGWLDVSEKKFAPDAQRLREAFALRRDDILLCRTNGTLAYVGAAALVQEDMADMIFPDKVIRVRLQQNVLPAYFWQVLKTPFLRAQIESFARTAVGNYAMGGKDVWKLRLPLPPLDIQKSLVHAIAQARDAASRLREDACQERRRARQTLERALLGTLDSIASGA
ncbi:MAG: hypothetical protein BGO13_12630 [Burkholderiales bacterium 66-5]|nr:MAG: hypothetical protein BGO13_12630 [Burkholderiales bacterium 66-5]